MSIGEHQQGITHNLSLDEGWQIINTLIAIFVTFIIINLNYICNIYNNLK